jgi:hypothetical protein
MRQIGDLEHARVEAFGAISRSSAAAIASPTPRVAAMARSRSAGSLVAPIAREAAPRSALSVSTWWIAARRSASSASSASISAGSTPTVRSAVFTASGCSRIRRISSTAAS